MTNATIARSFSLAQRCFPTIGPCLTKALYQCAAGLLLLFAATQASQTSIVSIPSADMNKSFNAAVITPEEYKNSSNRFSVVYLLHGYSGDYLTWSRVAPLDEYADRYHVVFVCPDGNFNSWYMDSPVRADSKFESYLINDVVPFVDKNYRTWAQARGRAIIGSSMGGHGAATILAKHCSLFCGAGSISGIMDLTEFPSQWDLHVVLGDFRTSAGLWKSRSFLMLCEKLVGQSKALILDCGESDFALPGNRRTHEKLLAFGIPHQYFERPGAHSLEYAGQNVEFHILYFSRILQKPGN
jgi:S-formylglutathione hydrolase FrmB